MTKRQRIEAYLDRLSSEQLQHLTQRELTVLRLIAEGYSTSEVATRMAYSERTIKNSIHDLVSRFHLRNRTHAVAFAVRQGLI